MLDHFPSQVDCHYLQLYLWRFVADEAVVQQVLEEVCDMLLVTLVILCALGAWLCPAPQPRARPDGGKRGGGHLRQGGIDLTCSAYFNFLQHPVLRKPPRKYCFRIRSL